MFLKRLRTIFFHIISLVFVFGVSSFSVLYYFGSDLPSELTLLEYAPPRTTQILARDGELIEEYATEHRVIVKFDEIPAIIKGAFIIAEDRDFYKHSGISANSLIRAIIDNTARKSWNKHPAGGSTITQQIAKNLLVGNARTVTRKIREAIMAFRIETTIPKDKILEIYLNHLYLGKGCYGIAEACNYYFGKALNEIEPHEAAFLASIPSAPTLYINDKNSLKLLRKRNSVLLQMYEAGYITGAQLRKYFNKPLKIKQKKQKLYAPYFADEIFRLATKRVSRNDFFKNGYIIRTTLDKSIQHYAQQALENGIIEYTKRTQYHGVLGDVSKNQKIDLRQLDNQLLTTLNEIHAGVIDKVTAKYLVCKVASGELVKVEINGSGYTSSTLKKGDIVLCRKIGKNLNELYQEPKVTGGILVMDAHTGEVLALVGGYSPYLSVFNCMTQARRQPGSTIKPFVYATALEDGKDEYDLIEDKPVKIVLASGEKYSPKNYDGKAHGKTYLRDGLIYSRNLSTVNLALDIGLNKIEETLKALGLVKNKVPISAVLGAIEVCPLKLMEAFSVFFNDGIPVLSKFTMDNEFATKDGSVSGQIFTTKTVDAMKDILHDAVIKGTNSEVEEVEKKYNIKIYGKTGTTNDYKDAWFLGAVQDQERTLLVCTFVGYTKPQTLGSHMTGAKVAFPIFLDFVKNYFENGKN